jgi:hypothetical protein
MSWDFQTMTSLPPWHLLTMLAPLVFGDPSQSYWPGPDVEWHERLLYIGIVPLMAAGAARCRWRWLCWGTALLAVALAFGKYVPWYAWAQVLPGYSSFRIPSKHLTLAALSLALAAGLGIDRLRGRKVAVITLVSAVFLLLASRTFGLSFTRLTPFLGTSDVLGNAPGADRLGELAAGPLQIASLTLLAAGAASLLPAQWAGKMLLLIAIIDLTVLLQPFRLAPQDPQDILYQAYGIRGYERAAVLGPWDVNVGNYGPVLHITQPTGYTALFSSGYATLMTGNPDPGVFVRVGDVDNPALAVLGYEAVFDNETRQLSVLQRPSPRAWVARCTWPGGADAVRDPTFPRQSCVTRSATGERQEPVAPVAASITAEGNSWLQINAEGPGWLMTGEPYYPGWTAEVDGETVAVEVLDGAVVGVPLTAGIHVIVLRYTPGGLQLGLALSAVAVLSLMGLWWSGLLAPSMLTGLWWVITRAGKSTSNQWLASGKGS